MGAKSCLALCDPVDCKPPGSSVLGTLKPRRLEWVVMPSSGDPPHTEIRPASLHLLQWQVGSLPLAPPGKLQ